MIGEPQNNNTRQFETYIGTAVCSVVGVNVDDVTFEQLMGYQRKEPFHPVVNKVDKSNQEYTVANFEIIYETVPEFTNGIKRKYIKTYTISNRKSNSPKKGTVEVIDRFGRSAWLTPEESIRINDKELYGKRKNGTTYLRQIEPASMRHAFHGESTFMAWLSKLCFGEDVNQFEKVAGSDRYTYVGLKPNADAMECRLDNVEKLFNGVNTEIINAIKNASSNKVKIAVGVRLYNGKTFNTIHDVVVRPYESAREIDFSIQNSKSNGYDLDTTWDTDNALHVYGGSSLPEAKMPNPSTRTSNPSAPAPAPAPMAPQMQKNEDLPF